MTKEDCVIIAGDFGGVWLSPGNARLKSENYILDELNDRPFTTLFVPGNHENYDRLMSDEFPTVGWKGGRVKAIRPGILMLMRGEMYVIDGAKVFAFGGASSHDIRDGLLDAADPEWKRRAKALERRGLRYYRVKGLSWWEQELPTPEELRHGEETLAANGWATDYVITHCAPTGIQYLLGRDDRDALTDWLEKVHGRLAYRKWYFGHYHANCPVNDRDELLYQKIVRVK